MFYDEIVKANDEFIALLGEVRTLMKNAEGGETGDHAALETLALRLEAANHAKSEALDRWLLACLGRYGREKGTKVN